MPRKREKVVVAMSGGVDSSVAACLLVEQGYEVVGLFMRVGTPGADTHAHADAANAALPVPESDGGCGAPEESTESAARSNTGNSPSARSHQGCCSAADAADARFVAGMLDIPFYALNFEAEFDKIIDYFADEYARGRTPNPCVMCNNKLKFGKLIDYADAVGARYIATGHYARIGLRHGANVLKCAVDDRKDQSYVLFGLDRNLLDRVLFPIGDMEKSDVRRLANKYNLPNQDKPDSVDICFVPDRDYARVVRSRRPDAFVEGDVLDAAGDHIGRHNGIGHYTIGQRRGLGIAAGIPIYVTGLDVAANTVTVGEPEALMCQGLVASKVNLLVELAEDSFRCRARIRYLHRPVPATATLLESNCLRVVFDEPQRAVTPGQAVVLYDDDVVIGGGWIDRAVGTPATGDRTTALSAVNP